MIYQGSEEGLTDCEAVDKPRSYLGGKRTRSRHVAAKRATLPGAPGPPDDLSPSIFYLTSAKSVLG